MDSPYSYKAITLHGDLSLAIIRARSLPNMDVIADNFRRCFSLCTPTPTTTSSRGGGDVSDVDHHHHDHGTITSDPYVTVTLAGATVARTNVVRNSENPVWNEEFRVPVAHSVFFLEFVVKDNDVFGADVIGRVRIPAARVATGMPFEEWFDVVGSSGRTHKPDSALLVRVQYTPVERNPVYAHGIAGDPEELGVRNTYFPLRKEGMVTLYQDAHVKETDLPKIELEGGELFGHGKCWEDICHAILEAHHLIYIVGWSIYDKVRLVREPTRPLPKGGELTLGELLKFKSKEGVRVCLLVWDDKTSHEKFFFKRDGVMQTHDEETHKFFKHSSVICELSPRYASSKLSLFKQQVVGTIYTHHQKCVLVDTHANGNYRKITAFIGGLDLCDGRYDTPEHRLFHDLDTVFVNDFHNPTFPTETKGPRQPWHDLHCKIEGPAAYDVLANFEQRWKKATRSWEVVGWFKKVSRWKDDALLELGRMSWILSPSNTPNNHPNLWVSKENERDTWHVQIFRSIDTGSIKDFHIKSQDVNEKNLDCEKNLVIEKSIHTAYVQAIRSAKNFIYIENQYFIGSSYGWPSYNCSGAENLIPMELALKIASKIRAGERFAVYIVIPMWPEGDPAEPVVQQILLWQSQTMQMMFEIIAEELKSVNLRGSHPNDYLNFYCLGNREPLQRDMLLPSYQTSDKSAAALSQKFCRFMIYVHSKGMIVDDEYVILGSANINQRSLDGTRDTEIAMGAYQAHHTWSENKAHPRGQIYGYRISLWREHLGIVHECFMEPHSLECVKYVNKIADDNWFRYTVDDEYQEIRLQGHLLRYPLVVEADGKVVAFRGKGKDSFPDTGGKIIGSASNIPPALTS